MNYLSKTIALTMLLSISSSSVFAAGIAKGTSKFVISNYAKTKYPMLMVHGFAGFTRLGTENFGLDYWYQILPDLATNGATVYAAQLSPVESTEIRGEQLLRQVDDVIALTGKNKVNLIGHSHGGPTIQYIEAIAPEKVASLTAVAGAMKGSTIANTISENNLLLPVAKALFNILGPTLTFLEGNTELSINPKNALNSLTTQGLDKFNQTYPTAAIPKNCNDKGQKITANGVYHYSWMGNKQITNPLDIIDTAVIGLSASLMQEKNHDGFVSVCSGNYGQVIRNDYNLNHLDEINQILGLKGIFAPDPVSIYRQHANRLKLEGL
ncbi:esterase/lipase family protein [Acinetobacter shaoyimingii]|uniref:Triacylglycerol lipase n=1 Tax=Acinetobacter shaoyimingii TaxID=2715164 RepID=A0A6G8RYS0_9GAMM|nr:triacylglycerol lipase [Acinetobacter shaoyimingii]QIO07014.1 triacylglycerol lipase [Acinetobacter shaoyimingii]